jgi:hypothetical protein
MTSYEGMLVVYVLKVSCFNEKPRFECLTYKLATLTLVCFALFHIHIISYATTKLYYIHCYVKEIICPVNMYSAY